MICRFLPSLLELCSFCMRLSDTTLVDYGAAIYEAAFSAFDNSFQRQEILGNIIGHIGSGNVRPFFMLSDRCPFDLVLKHS